MKKKRKKTAHLQCALKQRQGFRSQLCGKLSALLVTSCVTYFVSPSLSFLIYNRKFLLVGLQALNERITIQCYRECLTHSKHSRTIGFMIEEHPREQGQKTTEHMGRNELSETRILGSTNHRSERDHQGNQMTPPLHSKHSGIFWFPRNLES